MASPEEQPGLLEIARGAGWQLADEQDLRLVAAGAQPKSWKHTETHPQHGELTFTARSLPNTLQWARHSIAMDNLLAELFPGAEARPQTMMLVGALAALGELIECPVISEEQIEDPDQPEHIKIRRTYYDPASETNHAFVVGVFTAYQAWRLSFALRVQAGELGKSSGETRLSGSSTESAAPTASPSTTPA